jgi:hypothetical protein
MPILPFLSANPLLAWIAAGIFLAGMGLGATTAWTVQGWRLGGQIETLKGSNRLLTEQNAVLTDSNERCKVDVDQVRGAVKAVVDAAAKRVEDAARAMKGAERQAGVHLKRAGEILNRSKVAPDKWCATIQKEQLEYLKLRRTEALQ